MSKDLLYRPDLSYDKSYHTDGRLYDVEDESIINSEDFSDKITNKIDKLDGIIKEIQKYVQFEKIIINKCSFSSACNTGVMTFGFAFFTL